MMTTRRLVYHERQEAGLCAVHCLNALLQGPVFTEIDLMRIAEDLDAREAALFVEDGRPQQQQQQRRSANVSDDGNFSVQVITNALSARGLRLAPMLSGGDGNCDAFVCNHSSHWLCIRRTHGWWLNLNSLLRRPQPLSDTYVDLFLTQLQAEGYAVFRAFGALPPPAPQTADGTTLHGRWIEMDASFSPPRFREIVPEVVAADAEEDFAAAIAASLKDAKPPQQRQQQHAPPSQRRRQQQVSTDEDIELAIALSLSEQQQR